MVPCAETKPVMSPEHKLTMTERLMYTEAEGGAEQTHPAAHSLFEAPADDSSSHLPAKVPLCSSSTEPNFCDLPAVTAVISSRC